jgi:putative salt-induced outer membrane protein YdiY
MDLDSQSTRSTKLWVAGAALALAGAFSLASPAASAAGIKDTKATDILPGGAKKKRRVPVTLEAETSFDWTLSTGGSLSTGNTQSYAWNAGTDLQLISGRNVLGFEGLANLEGVNTTPSNPDSPYETSTKKIFAVARYTFYLTLMNGLWAGVSERWDPFAGYNTQFIASGGYLRAFIRDEDQNFSARVGYAFTYDDYSSKATVLPGFSHSLIHGLLVAAEYDIKINPEVDFVAGAAYIINVNDIPAQDAGAWKDNRVTVTAALISSIADRFDVEARFLMLYDSKPAADFQVDTTTLLNLIFTMF